MKNLNYIIFPLLLLFVSSGVFGQTKSEDNYYYYYKGKKVYLELDTKTISISLADKNSVSNFKTSSINTSEAIEDHTRGAIIALDKKAKSRKKIKTYYAEVYIEKKVSKQNYYAQIGKYKNLPNVVMVSPSFYTKGGEKMGLSNNFYVKLKNQKDVGVLYKKTKEMNVELLGHNKFMPLWFTLSATLKSGLNAIELANVFYETGLFESAEPAFMYKNLLATNDPFFNNQWALKNTGQNNGTPTIDINAEQAWSITTGDPNIKTAVFDHGLEMNHPDLQANIYGTGYDATTNSSPAQVRGSHGTACGGLVGAVSDNNLGVSGVAPSSRLISVSINLQFSDTPQQLANGFNWAWQNGADVISNSWGGYAPSNIIDDAITNTLTNGRGGKGTVVVFAAGNENNTNIRYPGNNNPSILVVGAMSPCGERKNPASCDGESWGSCFGSQLDIMAPGVKMPTTDRQGGNGYTSSDYTQTFNGTSSACPVVAGVVALVLSVNPNLTALEVNDIIEQSAQKVRTDLYTYSTTGGRPNGTWHNQMGYGLVDAYQAVLLAQSNECPENLTITQNVPSGQTDLQEANSTITATNIINSNATAAYDAGTRVFLKPGFNAKNGSSFRAFIEGCSQSSAARQSNAEIITYKLEPNKEEILEVEKLIKIHPNPNSGQFSLSVIDKDKLLNNYKVEVYNFTGKVVYKADVKDKEQLEIDLSKQISGIYFIKVITLDGVITTSKIIKK